MGALKKNIQQIRQFFTESWQRDRNWLKDGWGDIPLTEVESLEELEKWLDDHVVPVTACCLRVQQHGAFKAVAYMKENRKSTIPACPAGVVYESDI